jgi:hypothetical protein
LFLTRNFPRTLICARIPWNIALLNPIRIWADLDPLLQVLAIIAFIAFAIIGGVRLWRYLKRRKKRRRTDSWMHY